MTSWRFSTWWKPLQQWPADQWWGHTSLPGSIGLGGYCSASDCESDAHIPPCSPPGTYERLSGRHSHPRGMTGTGHAEKGGKHRFRVTLDKGVYDHCLRLMNHDSNLEMFHLQFFLNSTNIMAMMFLHVIKLVFLSLTLCGVPLQEILISKSFSRILEGLHHEISFGNNAEIMLCEPLPIPWQETPLKQNWVYLCTLWFGWSCSDEWCHPLKRPS